MQNMKILTIILKEKDVLDGREILVEVQSGESDVLVEILPV